jgi:hypothetical protein
MKAHWAARLECTNCSQPLQVAGYAAPLQAVVLVKKLELSWSEKALAPTGPLSLVTPVTLSKDPIAVEMRSDARAEASLPLPTMSGRPPGGRRKRQIGGSHAGHLLPTCSDSST